MKLRIEDETPELAPDLEWMLQSGQVSDALIAETLVDSYYRPVYRLALSLLDDPSAADEAVVRTFLEVIRSAHRYRSGRPVHLWLYATALKVCRRVLPGLKAGRAMSTAPPGRDESGAGLPPPENEAEARLWLALDTLPERESLSLVLQTVHGLTPAESGLVSGQGEAAARRQMERARRKLPNLAGHEPPAAGEEDPLARSLQRRWPDPQPAPGKLEQVRAEVESRLLKKGPRRALSASPRQVILGGLAVLVLVALGWFSYRIFPEDGTQTAARTAPRPTRAAARQATAQPPPDEAFQGFATAAPAPQDPDESRRFGSGLPAGFLLDLPATPLDPNRIDPPERWNDSGPVVLTRVLRYWELDVEEAEVIRSLQPNPRDENVMPYEMAGYIAEQPGLKAAFRMGGDFELLASLVSAGFPVILEKGYQAGDPEGWRGHYVAVTGYELGRDVFIRLVSSLGDGSVETLPYRRLEEDWRAFNYTYLVVYPDEREAKLMKILGEQAEEAANYRYAYEKASAEIYTTHGLANFFAWFNRGTSLTYLDDYQGAALAYDQAFEIYESLSPAEQRPWRILWYQSRPYWAYYYTGRYEDVIRLAEDILGGEHSPILEESYYWRALAKEALGDIAGAISDLEISVHLNPHFTAGRDQLQRLRQGSS